MREYAKIPILCPDRFRRIICSNEKISRKTDIDTTLNLTQTTHLSENKERWGDRQQQTVSKTAVFLQHLLEIKSKTGQVHLESIYKEG